MQTTTMPGSFADVTSHNGSLYVAVMQNDVVVAMLENTTLVETARYACGGNGFARIKSAHGMLWLIYRPQSGQSVVLINLTLNDRHDYPGTFYNWPVCFGANGYAINYGGGNGPTLINDYNGNLVQHLDGGTPTGLARVADDNHSVVTIDDNRGTESQWGVLNPEYAGDVFCGEGMTGGVPLVYQHSKKIIYAEFSTCFVPKITQQGTEWAVATTDYTTMQLISGITAADFGVVTVPPVEPPVEPPPTGEGRIITITGPLKAGDVIKIV